MKELWPIFIFSLIMAYMAEKNSVSEIDQYGSKKYIKKDKLIFFILFLGMSMFVGLRTSHNDTGAYRHAYELMEGNWAALKNIDLAIGNNPGFKIVNTVFKMFHVSTQSFLMIYALITNGIYIWFIRKYSNNYLISIFLYSTMGVFGFTMAAIKQCVAVAFCLLATDRAINKKYFRFILWVLIAMTFHPYSLMYLIVPFLNFVPWSGKTFVLLGIFAVLGIGLESLLGSIINITTMFGEEYNASTFVGEGVNIFRLMVVWIPVFISFICKSLIKKKDDKNMNLIMNLSMLNAEIMFIALFGTANYFARLANYFLVFQTIALPWELENFNKPSKKMMELFMLIGFMGYFYYGNSLYGGFDVNYSAMGLWEYLMSILN